MYTHIHRLVFTLLQALGENLLNNMYPYYMIYYLFDMNHGEGYQNFGHIGRLMITDLGYHQIDVE